MPRKPKRGRFLVVVPFDGGDYTVESFKEKSLTAPEIVASLREYADFIEKHFVDVPAEGNE